MDNLIKIFIYHALMVVFFCVSSSTSVGNHAATKRGLGQTVFSYSNVTTLYSCVSVHLR